MSSASTATILEASETSSSFMLPGMASPEEELQLDASTFNGRVRFDNECVLIPESPKIKRSMVLTKSYSLPLWRKRGQQASDSDIEDPRASARSPSPEDSRVVIKVPIPTFRRRSSRSPTRGRSVSASPVVPGHLPPCLVHRSPSMSPIMSRSTFMTSSMRRPSLPIYHRRKDEMTIPLRECCHACERITEESIKEGDHWQEKFSRGAKRRRSASLDQQDAATAARRPTAVPSRTPKEFASLSVGVNEALELEFDAAAHVEAAASPRIGGTSTFSLTVDEVDKRRKSIDFSKDEETLPYTRQREASTSSNMSSADESDLAAEVLHTLRSSPIEEEDEAQLFPLPRKSSSRTPSPRASPVPSPSGSSTYLPGIVTGSVSSKSKIMRTSSGSNSSQESLLRGSLTRKPPTGVGIGLHLSVPSSASSSRNVSPSSPLSVTSPTSGVVQPPSPSLGSKTPALAPTRNTPRAPRTPEERTLVSPVSPKGPRLPIRAASLKSPIAEERKITTPIVAALALALSTESTPPLPAAATIIPVVTPTPSSSSTSHSSSTPPSEGPPTPAVPPTPTSPTRHHHKAVSEPGHIELPPIFSRFNTNSSSDINTIPIPTPVTLNARLEAPLPPLPTLRTSTSHHHLHMHMHSPFGSSSSNTSAGNTSPSPSTGRERSASSPQSPGQRRKVSFTAPFMKAGGAIRGVGADVLKGVSSMGGGSAVL